MPYNFVKSYPQPMAGHKQGRYVLDRSGFLHGREGEKVDLHSLLTNHSASYELFGIHTNEMRASGLHPGGFALVDRSIKPFDGCMVVTRIEGAVTVRHLIKRAGQWYLMADDPRERELLIDKENMQIENLGVVTASIILCLR